MFETQDTIVAISSAAGEAARAVVRLSGPEAIELAGRVFQPATGPLAKMGGFRAADGLLRLRGSRRGKRTAIVDIELPARAYVFRAPRSFTRQDVVEVHLPGVPAVEAALTGRLIEAGARQAQPGEFTARAFFSGRIDLSAAQAVADLIDASDDAQLRSAVAVLGGTVQRLCQQAASEIADILAAVEASIDLTEEGLAVETSAELARRLIELSCGLNKTATEASSLPELARSPVVVLIGRPNVGKSSLLNALSGTDRAIVSALAGTTRDVLSATLALPGGSYVSLLDAAGFAPYRTPLAAAARRAARQALKRADAIVLVIDAADPTGFAADRALADEARQANRRAPVLLLANKVDLPAADWPHRVSELEACLDLRPIATSALTGLGLQDARQAIADLLCLAGAPTGNALGLHERQKRCLLDAASAARQAAGLLQSAAEAADVAELAAVDLRESLAQLGQVSGQIVTEEILGRIFARFCVGK